MAALHPTARPVAAAALLLSMLCAASMGADSPPRLREAHLAWDRGDYTAALRAYLALLDATETDGGVLREIALQTGELFHTTELTSDGGSPRFSPDGRYMAYDIGRGPSRHTRVARVDDPAETVAHLPGHSAAFSPDGSGVAYVEAEQAGPAGSATSGAGGLREGPRQITWRSLPEGTERRIAAASRSTTELLVGAGGTVLFTSADADGIDQVHVAAGGQPARALTHGAPGKVLHAINAAGTAALFTYRLEVAGDTPSFGLLSLPQMTVARLVGSAPAFSADGHTLAFVRQTDTRTELLAASTSSAADATVVRVGPDPLDAPALSPDGSRVAFMIKVTDDWDLHVVNRDGTNERRITTDIQHDVSPRFLSGERLLGLLGEPRHRRSFVYDLPAGARTRLFHNNSVRTIAPEYQWAASPDGARVLIGADRDGDTISPARGVYLVDLTRTVSREELRARLTTNLAAEDLLRSTGRRLFAPLAGAVRRVVAEASIARVFDYQQALFVFGSKHISQPGNRRAGEYLFDTYASFGYEPEYQWFESEGALGGRTANVLATLRGTLHPELVYVVSSHYDSVRGSPGADDNSSGTAALLEVARLMAGRPQPATIVFASFTGEESGLLGSREFVRRAVAARTRIAGALNNDMIGWTNDHRLDNTIRYGSPGIRDVQHAAAIQFTRLVTYDARYFRGTDALAYYEAFGEIFGGIGSYPVLGNPHYHQPHDTLETVNHALVTEVARTTAASIMLLASSPAPVTGLALAEYRDGRATLSWTAGAERDVTGYVVEWPGSPGQPVQQLRVPGTRATIQTPAGTRVSVKAVNAQGLEGWDSSYLVIR